MKEKGEKPKRKKIPFLDPDHFDDSGEEPGDLEALANSTEELCWWENPDKEVDDIVLDASSDGVLNGPHWLNDTTTNPKVQHFLGFEALRQHRIS